MVNTIRNYLRVRGEYLRTIIVSGFWGELPPRARRIPVHHPSRPRHHGTTSACAENTCQPVSSCSYTWNYLRVRGEYKVEHMIAELTAELPPRARRIPDRQNFGWQTMGTTSACAENTGGVFPTVWGLWNYLRVRGEYSLTFSQPLLMAELPPRARRIQRYPWLGVCCGGTTSACAENTNPQQQYSGAARNYLRVRGEYYWLPQQPGRSWELPPRARRILIDD